MSYDISWRYKNDNDEWVTTEDNTDANITWNVRDIIVKSTGLPWKNEDDNGLVSDVMVHIENGLKELKENPEKYLKLESPNGWGTIEGTMHFFKTLIDDWNRFKDYKKNKKLVNRKYQ